MYFVLAGLAAATDGTPKNPLILQPWHNEVAKFLSKFMRCPRAPNCHVTPSVTGLLDLKTPLLPFIF